MGLCEHVLIQQISDESGSEEEPVEDLSDVNSQADDDDDPSNTKRPYMSLLQSLSEEQQSFKKRKLNDQKAQDTSADSDDASEPGSGDDEKDPDQVEEEEDVDGEEEEELAQQSDDSEDEDSTDPFDVHFAHPDEHASAAAVGQAKKGKWTTERSLINNLRATAQCPGVDTAFKPAAPVSSMKDLKLKSKLQESASKKLASLDEAQKAFASQIFDYKDILFSERTPRNSDKIRSLICLHVLNHVFK